MAVYELPDEPRFPDPELAEPEGLLAVGGDLRPERLTQAHALGIFPWYSDDDPILWWSPDPRLMLEPGWLHVPRSLARVMRRRRFRVTVDTAFPDVIARCATKPRPGQDGTWITPEMEEAYCRLHLLGLAHSVEARDEGGLVGGLYGVSIGSAFFGESMFADRSEASKVAFVTLVRQLAAWDFDLIDCQLHTPHLARFGAREVSRREYLERLAVARERPTRRGPWRFGEPRVVEV